MLRKMHIVLAVTAMMTLSSFVLAQKDEDIQKEVEGKIGVTDAQRKDSQEKGIRQVEQSFEMSERAAAVKCPLGVHSTILGGINDNLALPFDPVFKSPALAALFPNTKLFDDPALNRIFAHSFAVRNYKPCEGRACKAQLLVHICNSGQDLWQNDKLYVGSADKGQSLTSIFYGNIWSGNEAKKCKDMTIPINPATLAGMSYLDIVMQDDSNIDYMQLDLYF
jgi:hypothetical protein